MSPHAFRWGWGQPPRATDSRKAWCLSPLSPYGGAYPPASERRQTQDQERKADEPNAPVRTGSAEAEMSETPDTSHSTTQPSHDPNSQYSNPLSAWYVLYPTGTYPSTSTYPICALVRTAIRAEYVPFALRVVYRAGAAASSYGRRHAPAHPHPRASPPPPSPARTSRASPRHAYAFALLRMRERSRWRCAAWAWALLRLRSRCRVWAARQLRAFARSFARRHRVRSYSVPFTLLASLVFGWG